MSDKPAIQERRKQPAAGGYIVGIGASAGGLEALQHFFDHMVADSGLSFVVIQHLSPNYKSFMAEILAKNTRMRIYEAENQMEVKPNCVYLIPPRKAITINNRKLQVTGYLQSAGLYLPIDMFLTSLAMDVGTQAVGVILSGTGSDGTRGAEAIKQHGGLVIVQDEKSAKFDGMPNSARSTGCVDHVLAPSAIANYLLGRAVVDHEKERDMPGDEALPSIVGWDEQTMQRVFELLNMSRGIDFSHYKQNSIFRRMERRMSMIGMNKQADYLQLLQNDENELGSLVKDLLIGVTRFFRDAQAFEALQHKVIPAILESKQSERQIRIWAAGCSTGEEAYSLAILFHQHMAKTGQSFSVKIFATDLDQDSIDFAGHGVYPEAAMKGVSKRLRKTYFTQIGDMHQINKEIRNMVVFASHNMIKDPPFHNLDLITCRNMLIYLQSDMQQKLISLFHAALNPNGYLFLGPSETLGRLANLFTPFERKWNIFQQHSINSNKAAAGVPGMNGSAHIPKIHQVAQRWVPLSKEVQGCKKPDDLYTTFVDEHLPPCMVIDENNEVLHLSGNINPYLALARGKPSWNIYKMVEAHLSVAIVTAIQTVRRERRAIYYKDIKVNNSEHSPYINLIVKPFSLTNKKFDKLVLVSFEESAQQQSPQVRVVESFDIDNNVNQRMVELEQELQRAEESLQATIEELETSNEELQATNEELVAANEELMSTNEELQSVNEELVTVNLEYQYKILELTDLNNDMDNFLVSTRIGTIFLDRNMCIRRFTPVIAQEINLLDADCGRPLAHISHNFRYNGFVEDAKRVLRTLVPEEREIQNQGGKWYSMRVLPYRTSDNVIKGIVLTFVDITELKSANIEMLKLSYAIEQSPSITVIAGLDGTIEYVNPKFTEVTGFEPADAIGGHIRELQHWEGSSVPFTEIWSLLSEGQEWKGELESHSRNGLTYWESVKFLPIKDSEGQTIHYLKIAEDMSERRHTEELLRKSEMLSAVGQLAAGIAHEIRNPLTALKGFTKLLRSGAHNDSYLSIMSAELERIEQIVSELLVLAKPQAVDYLPKSVSSILNDVIMLLDTQAIITNVEIVNEIDDPLPLISCVENQLKQVFINVVKNGVEAMPDGGQLIVRARLAADGMVNIGFIDHGCGIPEKKLARLGEPFYTTKSNGTGLGLMVSYKIIENHQGVMVITSKENVGTAVVIQLPTIS